MRERGKINNNPNHCGASRTLMNPQPLIQSQVIANFPLRPRDSHKGLFGTVMVIGGASGMVGAPLLAGGAALKMGAGCVHVVLLADNAPCVDHFQPELMLHPASLMPQLPGVIALGCGLGRDILAQRLLLQALESSSALVLDADALNILALRPDLCTLLQARNSATVLTPHPGEAARLLSCDIKQVQGERIVAVRQLARQFSCSVVLKGNESLCSTRSGHLYVNHSGNPGMSSAGMGDALTGMIAAFIAQKMSADDALLLAVHLHGAAGDALAALGIELGMSATELILQARRLLNQWIQK
jgi:ADP-dependent NAD(P)H-hydrate dehydratase / NAD(P)H-hydrate epimerase